MIDVVKIRKELNRSILFLSIMRYAFVASLIGTTWFIFDILKLLDTNEFGRFLFILSISIFFSSCAVVVGARFEEALDRAKECLKKLDNL